MGQFDESVVGNDLFRTSFDERPHLQLGIAAYPEHLPPRLWPANVGVSNWADLVLGLAIDEASTKGVEPQLVCNALQAGRLFARALFVLGDKHFNFTRPSAEELEAMPPLAATIVGLVRARGNNLLVAGSEPPLPPSAVMYHEYAGGYAPHGAQIVKPQRLHPPLVRIIGLSPSYEYTAPAHGEYVRPVPTELWAGHSLNSLTSRVVTAHRSGKIAVRTEVSFDGDTTFPRPRLDTRLA